jgi:hypothetical protein
MVEGLVKYLTGGSTKLQYHPEGKEQRQGVRARVRATVEEIRHDRDVGGKVGR